MTWIAVSPSASASTYWFKRAGEAARVAQAHQLQAQAELDQEVGGAGQGVAPADADQVLDHHRLVARGGPEDRRAQPRQLLEAVEHPLRRHLGDDGVGDRGRGMVGGAQEHAAKAHEVAGHPEVDHLPAAVGQQLVAAGPALLQDEGALAGLALVDQLGAGGDRARLSLEAARAASSPSPSGMNRSSLRANALRTVVTGLSFLRKCPGAP